MARDFEDLHDLDDLSDRELRDLVHEHLAAHNALDIDELEVTVRNGMVFLNGRVGTDEERQIADHVVSDVLGIGSYENGIFVDAVRRATSSESVDDVLVEESREDGLLLGDRPRPLSPEAEHQVEDLDARLFGTTDVQSAISEGTPWVPPETPTPEGPAGRGEFGEDH